jgi:tRNA threonylcarbamoyladenosine biosynthesis protein TsaB
MRSILGIDTASPDGSVALAVDGHAVAFERLLPREHSSGLSHAVERILLARGLRLGDLSGIAVSQGPGSFTGLRIGLAWAKGFALGRNLPLALVSAHEAAARADREAWPWIAAVLPSERGFVEVSLWDGSGSKAWGPEKIETTDAVERLVEEARARTPRDGRSSPGAFLELRPSTEDLASALAEDASDLGVAVRAPVPLAPAVAELGDRRLEAGAREDLVQASPAYGREPNARRPSP